MHFIIGEPHTKTMSRLENSFALLSSSKSEKYPVVICEAMKAGIPFISTDTGIVSYLPGGIIVSSEKEMSYNIDRLETDLEYRSKLAEKAKTYARCNQNFVLNASKLQNTIENLVKYD